MSCDPQNYHPLNHTFILAGLMKGIAKDQLIGFPTTSKLIGEGYTVFLSTHLLPHATLTSLSRLLQTPTGSVIMIIFSYVPKAFDRRSHECLLLKVKSYGLVEPIYSWVILYFSGHTQKVSIIGTPTNHQRCNIRQCRLGP